MSNRQTPTTRTDAEADAIAQADNGITGFDRMRNETPDTLVDSVDVSEIRDPEAVREQTLDNYDSVGQAEYCHSLRKEYAAESAELWRQLQRARTDTPEEIIYTLLKLNGEVMMDELKRMVSASYGQMSGYITEMVEMGVLHRDDVQEDRVYVGFATAEVRLLAEDLIGEYEEAQWVRKKIQEGKEVAGEEDEADAEEVSYERAEVLTRKEAHPPIDGHPSITPKDAAYLYEQDAL